MTRAHPAGPRHADVIPQPEDGAGPPDAAALDVLPAAVWPRHAARGADGVVRLAGVDVTTLARDHGTPLFVVDEADFRANRLVDRLDRLRGLPVHVACGVNDRYLRINQWLAGQLDPGTQVMWRRGNHTPDLWRLAAPVQLRFVADHL